MSTLTLFEPALTNNKHSTATLCVCVSLCVFSDVIAINAVRTHTYMYVHVYVYEVYMEMWQFQTA